MGFLSGLMGNASAVSVEDLEKEYGKLICENEKIVIGFKLIRDMFIFTNKSVDIYEVQKILASYVLG